MKKYQIFSLFALLLLVGAGCSYGQEESQQGATDAEKPVVIETPHVEKNMNEGETTSDDMKEEEEIVEEEVKGNSQKETPDVVDKKEVILLNPTPPNTEEENDVPETPHINIKEVIANKALLLWCSDPDMLILGYLVEESIYPTCTSPINSSGIRFAGSNVTPNAKGQDIALFAYRYTVKGNYEEIGAKLLEERVNEIEALEDDDAKWEIIREIIEQALNEAYDMELLDTLYLPMTHYTKQNRVTLFKSGRGIVDESEDGKTFTYYPVFLEGGHIVLGSPIGVTEENVNSLP